MHFRHPLLPAALAATLVLLTSCGERGDAYYEPPRPSALPDEAVYAGGLDGGYWMQCQPNVDHTITCTVFDRFGDPDTEHTLRICPGLRATSVSNGRLRPIAVTGPAIFSGVNAFDTQPYRGLEDSSDHEKRLAEKSYRTFGVTENCEPAGGPDSLLRYVDE